MPPRKKTSKAIPNEAAVASYLEANPDFLLRHGELLERMLPPARDLGEGVSDFQRFLVERLKGQVQQLRETQQALISAGRANEMNLGRIHGAALRLVEAKSLAELGTIVAEELPDLCEVDAAALALESSSLPDSVAALPAGTIDIWLGPADAMLRANAYPMPDLFGAKADSVRSFAMMRVETGNNHVGVVAFGSGDPEWFTPDQGTDLIAFLSGVIARQINRFPA